MVKTPHDPSAGESEATPLFAHAEDDGELRYSVIVYEATGLKPPRLAGKASSITVAQTIFKAVSEESPDRRVVLLHGDKVVATHGEVGGG
jgi:hypothetical protein